MAIFGLFKKDKSKPPSSLASSSSVTADDAASSEDFVHARQTLQPPSIRGTDDGYTSSVQSVVSATPAKKRGKLPFGRKTPLSSKKSVSTLADHKLDTQHSPLRKLTLNLDTSTNSLPLQSAIFPSFHHSGSSPTLSSPLPASEPRTPARPHVQPMQKATDCPDSQKSNGNGRLFGWRERKKFRTPKPDEALIPPLSDDHSFNLRSFRHVLPDHPPESPQGSSPTQTAPKSSLTPPARPRGASVASSDSSQRISVAAFREAQARRSSTNLTSGSPSPTIRPLSVANSSVSDLALTKQTSRPTRSGTPSAPPMPTQRPVSSFKQPVPKRLSSSSDASSSEDSESEDGSPSRSRSRLSRQRTITKSYRAKSDLGHEPSGVDNSKHRENICSRSELGHGRPVRPSQPSHSPARGPPPSSFQKSVEAVLGTRSASLYKRQRASYSVGEINLTTTSARANMPKDSKSSANPLRSPAPNSDTSETTSDSDSSDDDAPLASLAQPRRPGSAMSLSSTSTSTPSRKPLINLNTRTNPISGKPLMDEKENVPSRSTLISPTNINSRLSKLTAAAGLGTHHISTASKSAENLSNASRIRPPFVESPQDISPASTVTVTPPVQTSSQQSVESARRASMPAVPTLQGAPSHTDDLRPIAVQGREQNSGFRVVSRPLKSPTSPLPQSSSYVPAHSQNPQRPSLGPRSATSSSVSGATNTSPRIQNTLPILNTRPLVPSPKPSTSSVPSSTPSSFHSRQSMDSTASSSNMSSRLGVQNSPQRPFLSEARRRDSPASSTGGSSNGPAPLTPADGSDYFSPNVRGNGDSPGDSSTRSTPQSAMKGARGHLQRASVSFQGDIPELDNDLTLRGKKSNHSLAKPKYSVEERENRRRDRRRSEAKAAIELGNIVNGKGPKATDEEVDEDTPLNSNVPQDSGMSNNMSGGYFNQMPMGWPVQGMPQQMMGGMPGMMGGMATPQTPGMNMMPPQPFMFTPPPPNADAAFIAAHQQAMLIAKQAYQYAVAQQAMQAAGDEWERGSTASAFTPSSGMGLGMGMPGYGMNPMWGNSSPMFPPAPRSMYAGSMYGPPSDANWGAASVYGETFGPTNNRSSRISAHKRNSSGGALGNMSFPEQGSGSGGNVQQTSSSSRPGPRPRTKTAPSNANYPTQHRTGQVPPSSWKVGS